MEIDYDKLDKIVALTYGKLMAAAYKNNGIILTHFSGNNKADWAVYHIASQICDLTNKPFKVYMPFMSFLKFKWKMRYSHINCGRERKAANADLKGVDCQKLLQSIKDEADFPISYFSFMTIYDEYYAPKN